MILDQQNKRFLFNEDYLHFHLFLFPQPGQKNPVVNVEGLADIPGKVNQTLHEVSQSIDFISICIEEITELSFRYSSVIPKSEESELVNNLLSKTMAHVMEWRGHQKPYLIKILSFEDSTLTSALKAIDPDAPAISQIHGKCMGHILFLEGCLYWLLAVKGDLESLREAGKE